MRNKYEKLHFIYYVVDISTVATVIIRSVINIYKFISFLIYKLLFSLIFYIYKPI